MNFYHPKVLDVESSKCGNISVFEWITSIFRKGDSEKVWYNAAKYGNIKLIKHVKYLGYPSGKSTYISATKYINLRNLIWARENGCKWDADICSFAAHRGHFEALARNAKMGQKKWMSLGYKYLYIRCRKRTFLSATHSASA
jgi:hypothetical protein